MLLLLNLSHHTTTDKLPILTRNPYICLKPQGLFITFEKAKMLNMYQEYLFLTKHVGKHTLLLVYFYTYN